MNIIRLNNKDLCFVKKEKIIKDEANVTSIEFLIPTEIDDITFFDIDENSEASSDCSFGILYCIYSKQNIPTALNKSDLTFSSDDIVTYYNDEKYVKMKWAVSSEISNSVGSCVFCFVASKNDVQIFKSDTQYFLINQDGFPSNSVTTEDNIIDTWSNHFERKLTGKQDILIAGDNITIANGVISASCKGNFQKLPSVYVTDENSNLNSDENNLIYFFNNNDNLKLGVNNFPNGFWAKVIVPANDDKAPTFSYSSSITMIGQDCGSGKFVPQQGVRYCITLMNYGTDEQNDIIGQIIRLDRENSFYDLNNNPFNVLADVTVSQKELIEANQDGINQSYLAGDNFVLNITDENGITLDKLEIPSGTLIYPAAIHGAANDAIHIIMSSSECFVSEDGETIDEYLLKSKAEDIFQKIEDLPYKVLSNQNINLYDLAVGHYLVGENTSVTLNKDDDGENVEKTDDYKGVRIDKNVLGTLDGVPCSWTVEITGSGGQIYLAYENNATEPTITYEIPDEITGLKANITGITDDLNDVKEAVDSVKWTYKIDETATTPIIAFTDNFNIKAFGEITNLQITTSDTTYDPLYNAVVTFLSPESSDTETVTPTELTYPSTLITFLGDDCTDGVLVPQLDTGYEINVSWIYGKGLVARVGGFPR